MDGPTAIRKGKKQEKPDENRALNYLNYHFNSYYFFQHHVFLETLATLQHLPLVSKG